MNYLKKKLKPLTSGLTSVATNASAHNSHPNKLDKTDKDLEDDLYDEYVIEAPPHPSELLALGVDPSQIDVNDPEKLKELYRKAKEEGKDKVTNSVLLARQRQKEEIEEKKKTREEWKFFDSITARVEQAVKDSQRTVEKYKESSAIDRLQEPEYELRLSADQVFKSSAAVKQEKSADNWIDFGDEDQTKSKKEEENSKAFNDAESSTELDEFGCPKEKSSVEVGGSETQNYIVEELLNDFGIDLRSDEQKKSSQQATTEVQKAKEPKVVDPKSPKNEISLKATARPRPKPNASAAQADTAESKTQDPDPFDTSFVSAPVDIQSAINLTEDNGVEQNASSVSTSDTQTPARVFDPFDTSFVNL